MIAARTTGALTLLALSTTFAHGQWLNDSTMHQVVADGSGEQVQPKIVPTLDGGCYVSWFSSDSGYDVRLQRLDSAGNEMWAHNGILVADRNFSSTQDYGLALDTTDHAVLVFRDDRFGGTKITVQRIAPDGSTPWGPDGLQFGNGTDFVASPDIATTDDDFSIIGWINEGDTHIAKISTAGMHMWTEVISDPGGDSIQLASMHRSDNNSIIMSWVQYTSFIGPKHLYAQKIAGDGSEAWPTRVAVYDGGSLQFGNFPQFAPDGMGGAVFSWYDTANSLNVYAQHLASDGTELFGHNGAAVSTNPRERVAPSAVYDSHSDSVFVSWIELDNNQGDQGVFTQRLDNTGTRMWTDAGIELSATDANGSGSVNVQMIDWFPITLWIENGGGLGLDQVLAHALVDTGASLWPEGTLPVASDFNQRSRLTTAVSAFGFIMTGWQIGDFGVADIQTHMITSDGSLGRPLPCPADFNGDGQIDFIDISGFLSSYFKMDPGSDFNEDGNWDFLDISIFLNSYAMGCP